MKLTIGSLAYNSVIQQTIDKLIVSKKQIFMDHMFIMLDNSKSNNEVLTWTLTKWPQTKFNDIIYTNKYISQTGYNGRVGPQYLGNPGFKWPKDSFVMTKSDELSRYLIEHMGPISQAINENMMTHGDKVETFVEAIKYLGLS